MTDSAPPEETAGAAPAPKRPTGGEAGDTARRERRERVARRVRTTPVPGTDPSPAPEPPRHTLGENDDRLKAEKPPHY